MSKSAYWKFNKDTNYWECSKCGCANKNIPSFEFAVPHMYSGARFCPQCGEPMSSRDVDALGKEVHE